MTGPNIDDARTDANVSIDDLKRWQADLETGLEKIEASEGYAENMTAEIKRVLNVIKKRLGVIKT